MPIQNYPSIPELRIKTDVLSTDAVVKLSSIVWYVQSDGTEVSLTSSDFGTAGSAWGVFEPRTSRQEFFRWTPSTISVGTSTGITITARGLPWGSDYTTESTNRKFAHPAGSKILLFTDYGAFWNQFTNKNNNETITEAWTFSSTPIITNVPTSSTQAANKAYVDGVAVAGGPDASTTVKGLVEIATGAELAAGTGTGGTGAVVVAAGSSFKNTSAGAGDADKVPVLNASGVLDTSFLPDPLSRTANQLQITTDPDSSNDAVRKSYADELSLRSIGTGTSGEAITAGQVLYVKESDGKLYKATAGTGEAGQNVVGFADESAGAADVTIRYTKWGGVTDQLSGLNVGDNYFLSSATAGAISVVAAVNSYPLGLALSSTTLLAHRGTKSRFIAASSSVFNGGTETITVGFRPSAVFILGLSGQSNENGTFFGMYGADGNGSDCRWQEGAASTFQITLSAFTQTGFTATYSNISGSPSRTVSFLAIG